MSDRQITNDFYSSDGSHKINQCSSCGGFCSPAGCEREDYKMTDSLYLVWNPVADYPKARHKTQEEAMTEAKRLAAKHPDKEFIVLRAVQSVTYSEYPWRHKCYSRRG